MSEFDLINQYFKTASVTRGDVALGIGDDCALLTPPPGMQLAVSTDTLISGVHFPENTSAEDIGHKSLAVNLSDLAAMGAEPAWVSLAISLPQIDESWIASFMQGFNQLARTHNVSLVGGDTTRGHLSITVSVVGFVKQELALRRDRAKAGDLVCVTGTLGNAQAGLQLLLKLTEIDAPSRFLVECLNRPQPQLMAGQLLTHYRVAAIDISDGLFADLQHICEASECGATIELADIPVSNELQQFYKNKPDWSEIVSGGDDYELCFCCSEIDYESIQTQFQQHQIRLSRIGRISSAKKLECTLHGEIQTALIKKGYNHFAEER